VGIKIREADFDRDAEQIAEALSKYLTPLADLPRFNWLYQRNPSGKVRAWLAFDNDEVIATAAAFPRHAYFGKTEISAWVLGDFCVGDRYRTLGPAVALQRELLRALDSSSGAISYDFPSAAMTAVYKRLKIEPVAHMVRMVKVLRVDRKVREHIGCEPVAKAVSALGNIVLAGSNVRSAGDGNLEISLQENKCGPEFDRLAERAGADFGFCVRRSADYINWRYLINPCKKSHLMTAKQNGALVGYAVFAHNGVDGEIIDIFGEDHPEFLGALIREVIELFRHRGLATVSLELLASHPWMGCFKNFGFYPRERKPFIVHRHEEGRQLLGGERQWSWFITGGDRD
jgi:hypothetical protein